MEEQKRGPEQQPVPKKSHFWKVIFLMVILVLVIGFTALYSVLNYFGERMLRKYLQDKILTESSGLYHADFTKLHLNLFTGKVSVDSFNLVPDTLRYNLLKQQGLTARALYRISFSSLTIDRVHIWQIWKGKRINFRQLILEKPQIDIVGFPDSSKAENHRWKVVYEDIYPAVSGLFNDFHIDSVKVHHGLFLSSFRQKTGKLMDGEYEFSAFLRDVSVNPFSYYNRNRVFYSRDVDLVIHHFDYSLADSLYLLKANEIGFSMTRSTLYGSGISLVPDLSRQKLKHLATGDLYRFDLPAFSISGVDLYKVMTDREVDIDSVLLKELSVKVYHHKTDQPSRVHHGKRKKFSVAGIYTILAKELRYISIDTVSLQQASFRYYGAVQDQQPELSAGRVNLGLSELRIDSLSHKDPNRLFYSRKIELEVEDFALSMKDGIHYVNAASIVFSTSKSLIDVRQCLIYPDRQKNSMSNTVSRNMLDIKVPQLTFSGIDLKKVFNRRMLDFDHLVINEPDVGFTRMKASRNPDPRFRKAEDFFEEENEEVVYNLLKRYLFVLKGRTIDIKNGYARISTGQAGPVVPVISGHFDLSMDQVLIDSVHGMNREGYFYSNDFDLDLHSLAMRSTDNSRHLNASRIHIMTVDSLILADSLSITRSPGYQTGVKGRSGGQFLSMEFLLDKLRLTGLNHKKLFLDKMVQADVILLENPQLRLKSEMQEPLQEPHLEPDSTSHAEFVSAFDVRRCIVKKGAFSYEGREDRNASYFSMKDIEFSVVNANIRIPQKGKQEGLIRFDSLQLNVFPIRADLAHNAYSLEASSLAIRSYPLDITLKDVRLIPLKKWMPAENSMQTKVSIPEIKVRGFYFDRAIFENLWSIDSLTVEGPQVQIELEQTENKDGNHRKIDPYEVLSLPLFMKSITVKKVNVNHANVSANLHRNNEIRNYAANDLMLGITRFHIDTATGTSVGKRLFNSDDISITLPGFAWDTPDSLYKISFQRFGLSTTTCDAFVDSVSVVPNFSREEFAQRVGHQTTRILLNIPKVTIKSIDLKTLLTENSFNAGWIDVPGIRFEAFLDKRYPFSENQRPIMPQQLPEKIRIPVSVDSVVVKNGYVQYEEQMGDIPGRIFFDRMNLTLTGWGDPVRVGPPRRGPPTPSGLIGLHCTTRLMGLGETEAWFTFFPGHPRDSFTLKATVKTMDLRELNPMMSKLVPVSVHRGALDKVEINKFRANDTLAVGELKMLYYDLAVKLHPKKQETWSKIEQGLLTELVNLLLPSSNPREDGKIKTGIIYYKRDPSRGFFNFVWKSTLSGIKSSVGIESKEQKQIRRTLKHK